MRRRRTCAARWRRCAAPGEAPEEVAAELQSVENQLRFMDDAARFLSGRIARARHRVHRQDRRPHLRIDGAHRAPLRGADLGACAFHQSGRVKVEPARRSREGGRCKNCAQLLASSDRPEVTRASRPSSQELDGWLSAHAPIVPQALKWDRRKDADAHAFMICSPRKGRPIYRGGDEHQAGPYQGGLGAQWQVVASTDSRWAFRASLKWLG